MLATSVGSSPISHYDNYHYHVPSRPSPLSPRSANAQSYPLYAQPCSLDENDTMPQKSAKSPSRTRRHSDLPFSKRPIKANPLLQRQKGPEAREQRRKMFLQKVSRERDDQRFEERGEQLLRLDWKSERRRWETEKAKSAPAGWEDAFELEEEGPIRSQSSMGFPAISQVSAMSVSEGPIDEEREAELQREREEREMDDLLALMDHGETQHSSRYGSDDEEYEGIFMELAGQQQSAKLRHEGQSEQHDFVMVSRDDEMDMSS